MLNQVNLLLRISLQSIQIKKLQQENRALLKEVHTDPLTGCQNRRSYDRFISQLGGAKEVSYIMIDVNDFASINNVRGHVLGDAILKEVGEKIRLSTPNPDTVYRSGGDEFVVVVKASLDEARAIASRLEAAVKSICVEGQRCSVSVGVGPTLNFADQDMYRAKRSFHSVEQ